MKKTILSSFCLMISILLWMGNGVAKPVDTLTAKLKASNFMQGRLGNGDAKNPLPARLVYTGSSGSTNSQRSVCFYVFNVGEGFVIMSADDRVEPVIGYSTKGHFDIDNIPENLQSMLDLYTGEIREFLRDAPVQPTEATAKWEALSHIPSASKGATVGPLLETTWNQDNPYNGYCPTDANGPGGHAYAGCVATAMAQIIRYWQYPAHSTGSVTYTPSNYSTISLNFALGPNYDYNNMPYALNSSSTNSQITEVAKLTYHCAVSVRMAFGSGGSGASPSDATNALKTNFKYSNSYGTVNPQYISKGSYTAARWIELLKTELDNWRPILYSGSGYGSHAFICDGYDDQGYFHFNWGWSGNHDGYFQLTSLTPEDPYFPYNFTNNQAAIINIQGNTPLIRLSSNELSFLCAANTVSEAKSVSLHGTALSNDITITAPANFEISLDGTNFTSSLNVSTTDAVIYVRYVPTASGVITDRGTLTLTSGSVTKTIVLTGHTYELDCNPPQNVQYASDNNGNVQLSWNAPVQEIHRYRFSIDSTYSGGRYSFGATSYCLAQRVCDSDLVPFHLKRVTQVSFYIPPAIYTSTSDHKIIIYQGGSYKNNIFDEGTLIREQSVGSISSGWNTVTLSEPVTIDADQELWYGVKFNTSNSGAVPVGTNSAVAGKGDLVKFNGTWCSIMGSYNVNKNIPVIMTIQDSPSAISNYTITRNNHTIGNTSNTQYGEHLTSSGEYTYNVTANWDNGCSATSGDVTMNVITDCTTHYGDTLATACGSFTWHDSTYTVSTEAATHTLVGGSAIGCDSTVTLHLTINQPSFGDTTAVECGSFSWYDSTYTVSTETATHTFVGGNAYGCDSTVTLHLTINQPSFGDTTATACGSFTWYDSTYTVSTEAATHTLVGGNAQGCDSTVTLHLTIHQPTFGDTTAAACVNFTWYDSTYTVSTETATHTFAGGNAQGCDSTVTLHLTIHQPTFGDTTAVECVSFIWYDSTYTVSTDKATHTFVGGNAHGCDSTVTLHLTIHQPTFGDTTAVECVSFTWYDSTYTVSTETATHTFVGGNAHGCDSTVTLHLTIHQPTFGDTTAVECVSFTWYDSTYTVSTETATHTFMGGNAYGCDSTVTLHLTIHQPTFGDTTAVECVSFTWHDSIYTASTETATHTFVGGNAYGCDSTVTLHLTINPTYTVDTSVTICESSLPYTFFYGDKDTTFDIGTPTLSTLNYKLSTINGCDSTVTLHLTINQPSFGDTTAVECVSFTWYDSIYTASTETATYTFVGGNANGCDSTVTLHLTINQPSFGDTTAVECVSFTWYDSIYTASTETATHTFIGGNAQGCDSTVTLHLTIKQPTYGDTTAVECVSFTWYDSIYTASTETATHTFVGGNAQGCDSTVTLHLTIKQPTYGDTTAVECVSFTWYDSIYTASTETATHTFVGGNAQGCDSTVTLHLTIYQPTFGDTTAVECVSFTWYDSIYTASTETATHTFAGGNAQGCDSTVTLHLTINPTYTVDTSVTICESSLPYTFFYGDKDTTFDVGTPTLSVLNYKLSTINGCDSTVTLHLTVNPTYYYPKIATATQGSLPYIWRGNEFYGDTVVYDSLITDAGCDSVYYLNLTVTSFNIVEDNPIILCQGESQTWRGRLLSEQGTYRDTVLAENTIYTVTVTVNPTYYIEDIIDYPQGSLPYYWHGRTFNENATAYDSLTTGAGCDSVYFLNLTVIPFIVIEDSPITLCNGEAQTWHGRLLSEQDTYRDTVLAENTIYTVTVTVNPTYYYPEIVTVTQGSLPYIWREREFNESTAAYDSLTTVAGCDSVYYLNLTVTSFNIVEDNPIILCQGESQTWRGRLLSEQGTYRDTVLTENTIYTVTVTVNPTYYHEDIIDYPQGSLPYYWHGRMFNESTSVYDSLSTAAGCDSVYFLNLTVIPFIVIEDNPITLCQGEAQTWRGRLLSEQDTYRDTVLTENTIYTVTVTVNPTYYYPEIATVTQGSLPYIWREREFNESTVVYDSLTTVAGCDSVYYLNLTVTSFNIVEDNPIILCQGESQTWRGRLLSGQGTYRDTVLTENTIYTVTVTVNPTYYFENNETIPQGSLPYYWHGRMFNENATVYDSLFTTAGCDSVYFLNLTVIPFNVIEDSPISLCQGEAQTWRGQLLSEQGIYSDTVLAENTIHTVVVTVNPTYYLPENVTVTLTQLPFQWHGQTFNESATAFDSLVTVAGCDSVFYLNLTVTTFTVIQDNPITLCLGETQSWRGHLLSEQGTYSDTALVESIIYMVEVTVNPTYFIPENTSVTQAQLPYHWHGQTFNESATAFDSLFTVAGCDSVFYLNLTVLPFNIIYYNPIALCQGETQLWRGHALTEQGTYSDTALVENVIYMVEVTVNPTYYVDTAVTITTNDLPYHFVSGQIDTIFSTLSSQSSVFTFPRSTTEGCDSIVTLLITLNMGIENHTADFIRAYPNPTSGILTVTGSAEFTQLQLFDAFGRRVGTYTVEGSQTEIDLHGLASGVYFLKAMRHNQTAGTLKIIKNKE